MKFGSRWFFSSLAIIILGTLLVWALRNVPLVEIWGAISKLRPWQLLVFIFLNFIIYLLFSLRWWIIIRAQSARAPLWHLFLVRLAVFGISYFTFGPQVGGEPLQVLALQRSYGFTYSRATASVLLDKLLEFLVNFLLMSLGLAAILGAGLVRIDGNQVTLILILLVVVFAWPPIHILMMYKHIYPLTAILRNINMIPKSSRLVRFLRASEWLAGTFCQRHPWALLSALVISIVAGVGMLLDYGVMITFLDIHLSFWEIVAGWTSGWLSFLVPLPGGLGALEASQVFVLGAFNISASTAISLTLLMRARDLLLAGLGLVLAGSGFSRVK